LASVFSGRPVRGDMAMTGEITLRGDVLPIGGLREKLMAALRAGIKKIIIPERNRKELVEVPEPVLKPLQIIPVRNVDQVFDLMLRSPLERRERLSRRDRIQAGVAIN